MPRTLGAAPIRLDALVRVAGLVLDAMADERRMLSRVADLAAGALTGTASVFLFQPADDSRPADDFQPAAGFPAPDDFQPAAGFPAPDDFRPTDDFRPADDSRPTDDFPAADDFRSVQDGLAPVAVNHPRSFADGLRVAMSAYAAGTPSPMSRLRAGEALIFEAVGPVGDPVVAVLARHAVPAVMLLPIQIRAQVIGLIVVTRRGGSPPFGPDDAEFGLALGAVVGTTIANARMLADSAAVVEELRRQGELMEHISDAMISCDAQGRIVSWNAAAEQIYGYGRGEALGCDLFALLATEFLTGEGRPLDVAEVLAEVVRTGRWRGELRERRADGTPLMILSSLTVLSEDRPDTEGLIVVNRDVSEQRHEEHQALHDALTGLPNRRLLTDRLYDALARAGRSGRTFAVLFLDLDKFKPVNDGYGHAAGDELLRTTAHRLTDAVRHNDTVSRLGGDEFVVVLEDAGTPANVRQVAERIRAATAEPVDVGGRKVAVSASIGVVVVTDGSDATPESLIEGADQAMYAAKRQQLGISFSISRSS
jgi:diguanylate cyclase (GGDEF)-like protein/PAS domain S-box-containing protein